MLGNIDARNTKISKVFGKGGVKRISGEENEICCV